MRLDPAYSHIYNLPVHSLTSKEGKTQSTENQRGEWQRMARRLHGWGLANLAAGILESNAAFATLAAQGMHVGAPLLNGIASKDKLNIWSNTLEQPELTTELVSELRKAAA
jgi:hypothetical protein